MFSIAACDSDGRCQSCAPISSIYARDLDKMLRNAGAGRRTTSINRVPASNVHHAIRIAEKALGMPLNLFVTINFSKTSLRPEDVSKKFARLRSNYFGPWVRRPPKSEPQRPVAPTYAWVIENGGDVLNAHWLVHVPPARQSAFRRRLCGWLKAVAGEIRCESAIDIKPAHAPIGACRHMLKGINPAYADFFGINHVPQGVVTGKRAGTSENLGMTAKKRFRASGDYPPARRWKPFPAAARGQQPATGAPAPHSKIVIRR